MHSLKLGALEWLGHGCLAHIGGRSGKGCDEFYLQVSTVQDLERAPSPGWLLAGKDLLLVREYDRPEIERYLRDLIRACDRLDWDASVEQLQRYFSWEFDDIGQHERHWERLAVQAKGLRIQGHKPRDWMACAPQDFDVWVDFQVVLVQTGEVLKQRVRVLSVGAIPPEDLIIAHHGVWVVTEFQWMAKKAHILDLVQACALRDLGTLKQRLERHFVSL